MQVRANGIDVEHRLEGLPGAPVVTLSHSLAATHRLWDAQAPALAARYRVLRYDVRGHGGSSVLPPPYTLEQMADDVDALLGALGIADTHFVGLSMGGLIGMTLALRHPARVRSLVLADTTACYGAEGAARWDERIRAAEAGGVASLVDATLGGWFTEEFRRQRPDVIADVRAMLAPTATDGYVGAIRAIGYVDLRDAIRAIRCPTLVMVGEHDHGTDLGMAETMHERIAGSELVVLPKAAHCSCIEAADEFNRRLLAFLGRVA
jgi:3-oxoadipate enol-lactonase